MAQHRAGVLGRDAGRAVDDLLGGAVRVNAEGTPISAAGATTVTDGLPFDEETVTRLLRDGLMASSGASIRARARTVHDEPLART